VIGHKTDGSLPSSAKVKKGGATYFYFLVCFHGIVLNQLSKDRTLPFYLETYEKECTGHEIWVLFFSLQRLFKIFFILTYVVKLCATCT
jgi:hypothetical protein